MGSKTLRAACGTKRRVCRSFCAWTDGALNVVAAAAAAAPWIACRRLIRLILEFLLATAVTPPRRANHPTSVLLGWQHELKVAPAAAPVLEIFCRDSTTKTLSGHRVRFQSSTLNHARPTAREGGGDPAGDQLARFQRLDPGSTSISMSGASPHANFKMAWSDH
jgi:hypothetical protein